MSVTYQTITADYTGQRIDNYLLRELPGVPKSRVYRALRKGEVRVNKKRVNASYRLQCGDVLRIPPLIVSQRNLVPRPHQSLLDRLEKCILFEDDDLMIVDKPAGIPVHGGSGISMSLINALRALRPHQRFLELAHRLDRATSGCLIIAKKRAILLECHELLRASKVQKHYLLLVKGQFPTREQIVKAPLHRREISGERMVVVDEQQGKPAETRFRLLQQFEQAALVQAQLITGRTHQIRVHCKHINHPIAGDEKYGDRAFNRAMQTYQLDRLFLHSASLLFRLPQQQRTIGLCALLPDTLQSVLAKLAKPLCQPSKNGT